MISLKQPRCTTCDLGPDTYLNESDFNVTLASYQVCRKCGWVLYENWCETRASGGIQRWLPPGSIKD
jgi:hypothetical protein